ncbi:MAG: AlpA family phage regulatory protein [Reyranella sp.]|nr:AlpA family phage regulatory protein [Reyranella sp.]
MLGVTTPTLYRWLRAGIFPGPTQIGLRTVAWPEPVVREWIAQREAARQHVASAGAAVAPAAAV